MNLTKQFSELAAEIQDAALKNNNAELFKQISILRNLMFDIKSEQYKKGVEMVENIVFKKQK